MKKGQTVFQESMQLHSNCNSRIEELKSELERVDLNYKSIFAQYNELKIINEKYVKINKRLCNEIDILLKKQSTLNVPLKEENEILLNKINEFKKTIRSKNGLISNLKGRYAKLQNDKREEINDLNESSITLLDDVNKLKKELSNAESWYSYHLDKLLMEDIAFSNLKKEYNKLNELYKLEQQKKTPLITKIKSWLRKK